jgi:hypothetical protein
MHTVTAIHHHRHAWTFDACTLSYTLTFWARLIDRQLRVIWALEHETIVQIATVVHSYEYDKQHTLALTLDGKRVT